MTGPPLFGLFCLFFFNDTATTEIYTLSLHDALPIFAHVFCGVLKFKTRHIRSKTRRDRKSTRLNSSHSQISYAVFCLKKKALTSPRRTSPDGGRGGDGVGGVGRPASTYACTVMLVSSKFSSPSCSRFCSFFF